MARDGGNITFSMTREEGAFTNKGCVCAETCGQPPSAPNVHCNRSHYQTTIIIDLNLGPTPLLMAFAI